MKTTQALRFRLISVVTVLVLGTLLNFPWQPAAAAPVNAKQAAAAVTGWLALDRTPLGESLGASVQRVDTFSDNTGSALYYVVYLAPSGFVIVAADDLVEPIIGFARAGTFDPSPTNPLGALTSNDLAARVTYARQMNAAALEPSALQAQAKWQRLWLQEAEPASEGPTSQLLTSVSEVRIAPLTQSTWDQGTAGNTGSTACYNYYTPPYGDGRTTNYPAGCVATALAQLMRYYQFPTTGVGSAGFTIYTNGSPLTYYLHGGNGAGGPYVWSDMPLMPPSSPPTAQCQAIGALVADAGATVNMNYWTNGSSASVLDGKNALTNVFHYSNATKGYRSGADIGAGLLGMMNPNLDARYPVLLGIKTPSNEGHAVAADGYGYSDSTLYHHLNLGWSGADSAWYALPLIDTRDYTFTTVHSCLYNVYTNGSGEVISGRVVDQIGRPVVAATVSATRTGGDSYTTTTDTNGIYALARIPSNSSYSIAVTKTDYSPASGDFSTGRSTDYGSTSGNYWGADFTMNMSTTVLDHLVWGAIGPTQAMNVPFGVTITAQNLTNGVATDFSGPVSLSAFAAGAGTPATMIGNLSYNGWLSGDEMTHGYAFTPSTNVQITAVRGRNTDKVSIWTDSGALIASQSITLADGWTEAAMATPVALSAGTTYRVGARIPAGTNGYVKTSSWPSTFANGTVGQNFYYSYGDVFPTSIFGSPGQGPLVDLRYRVVFTNSVPVAPTSSGAFASGVWSGNFTVGTAATDVVLKADDGAGHTALSSPFTVITALCLLSPQRLADGRFQCTVSGPAGQQLEILSSTDVANPAGWSVVTNLINTTGTISFTDAAPGPQQRVYRVHQLP